MKLLDYLSDRKPLLLFFFLLLSFITGTVYFDRQSRMLPANLVYMLLVSVVLIIIYFALEYSIKKYRFAKLEKLLQHKGSEWINSLPAPSGFEQKTYYDLLRRVYEEANIEINKYIDKSREDMEFLTAWVHQIKTPIAASRLIMENYLNSPPNDAPVCSDAMSSIEEEIDRIEDNVQKALYYSRINDFSKDYLISSVTMEVLVKECIKRHSKNFINKNIRIVLENLDYEISTDKKWLGFIMDQVMSNALKYTDRGGTIKVYAVKTDSEHLLHIEDSGIGIKAEDLGRVFDKSFTGYNGRYMYSSTGLGMYLSQKLARKLGHYITIASEYRRGTTVTIHFPKWSDYFEVTKM